MDVPNVEGTEENTQKPEEIISKKQSKLIILNPTMKEISKLENNTISDSDVPDILGEFKRMKKMKI